MKATVVSSCKKHMPPVNLFGAPVPGGKLSCKVRVADGDPGNTQLTSLFLLKSPNNAGGKSSPFRKSALAAFSPVSRAAWNASHPVMYLWNKSAELEEQAGLLGKEWERLEFTSREKSWNHTLGFKPFFSEEHPEVSSFLAHHALKCSWWRVEL